MMKHAAKIKCLYCHFVHSVSSRSNHEWNYNFALAWFNYDKPGAEDLANNLKTGLHLSATQQQT